MSVRPAGGRSRRRPARIQARFRRSIGAFQRQSIDRLLKAGVVFYNTAAQQPAPVGHLTDTSTAPGAILLRDIFMESVRELLWSIAMDL